MYLCVYVCMYINKDICIYVYIQISHRPRVIRKHAYMRTCPFLRESLHCLALECTLFATSWHPTVGGARKKGGRVAVGGRERERARERERERERTQLGRQVR